MTADAINLILLDYTCLSGIGMDPLPRGSNVAAYPPTTKAAIMPLLDKRQEIRKNSMIRLVPMTEAEFQVYLEQSIANYAQEHIKAGRWSPEDGLRSAQAEYQQLLPDGLATKDNYLFSIEDEELGKKVGILWFAVLERGGQT